MWIFRPPRWPRLFVLSLLIGGTGCGLFSTPRPAEPTLGAPTPLAETDAIRLEAYDWTFGEATGWLWVASLPRSAVLNIHPADAVQPLSAFPPIAKDAVLLNGGFYESGPMGLVLHGGDQQAPLTVEGGSGVLQWSEMAGFDIVHRNDWQPGPTEALQSIDRLVDAGVSLVQRREAPPQTARAAVALSTDRVMAVVAASDRSTARLPKQMKLHGGEDSGLPLWAFADLLVVLGARKAINLDGGISVEAIVDVGGERFTVSGGVGTINAVQLRAR